MPRGFCHRHGQRPCTCAMGNLYRFVEPVLLYALKAKGQTYGYELGGALQEHALTDAEIDKGALYRTLKQLETNGMVVSEWDVSGTGPARHLYKLTPAGEEHLREWIAVLDQLGHSIARFVGDARMVAE
jgi:PadR family transcriptional regulator, regulatory protein PadR